MSLFLAASNLVLPRSNRTIITCSVVSLKRVTEARDDEGDPEATPERGSWLRSLARDTLKSWGLHSLWVLIRRTSSARNHVVIFKHRGVALLAAVVHILPLAGYATIAWLLRRDRWIGDTLDPNLNLVIQIAAKVLELFVMASLSAMIFTFVRSEVALGNGAPLAAYLAGGAIRSPAYIISDEFWGMARGTFSSNPKKYCFLVFSLVCCVIASLTAPFTAAALQPINDWFTTGGTHFIIDTRGYPLLPSASRGEMITSNSTFGDGACAVAGNASCPSGGWESLLPLAALLPSINGVPGLWPIPYSEGTFTIAIRVHEPESRVLIPHRACALGIGRVVRSFEDALRKMQSQEGKWLRGSRVRYWTFGYSAGVITRCQVTVATRESLLQSGSSRSVVFPDVRSDEPLRLYQNMTIENPDLDRFLATRNASAPQVFFFNPDAALAQNVSIASVVSLPLNGGGDARPPSSVLYGCVSNTPWVEQDLETTQDRQMTGPAQPANVHWHRATSYVPATVHTSYAKLIDVPVEAAGGTTVFQRLAEAAGLGATANPSADADTTTTTHRTAERTVHHVETLVNLLLANGMSNTGAGAQPRLELRNENGAWWRDFFPFAPQFGINQIRDVLSLLNTRTEGAFVHPSHAGVPEAHQVPLWFNAAMLGYGYSAKGGGSLHSFRMVWMFVYVAIAALFTLWSVCMAGITSSSWDSPIEVVALALRSPKPKGEIMPTSLVEDPSVLGECYCVVAEGRDLELRPLRDWEGEPVPEGMKVRPNEEYR